MPQTGRRSGVTCGKTFRVRTSFPGRIGLCVCVLCRPDPADGGYGVPWPVIVFVRFSGTGERTLRLCCVCDRPPIAPAGLTLLPAPPAPQDITDSPHIRGKLPDKGQMHAICNQQVWRIRQASARVAAEMGAPQLITSIPGRRRHCVHLDAYIRKSVRQERRSRGSLKVRRLPRAGVATMDRRPPPPPPSSSSSPLSIHVTTFEAPPAAAATPLWQRADASGHPADRHRTQRHSAPPAPVLFVDESEAQAPRERTYSFRCNACGVTATPQTRAGPDGPATLCNRYALTTRCVCVCVRCVWISRSGRGAADFNQDDYHLGNHAHRLAIPSADSFCMLNLIAAVRAGGGSAGENFRLW